MVLDQGCEGGGFGIFFLRVLREACVINILMLLQIGGYLRDQGSSVGEELLSGRKLLSVCCSNAIGAIANGCARFRQRPFASCVFERQVLDCTLSDCLQILSHNMLYPFYDKPVYHRKRETTKTPPVLLSSPPAQGL